VDTPPTGENARELLASPVLLVAAPVRDDHQQVVDVDDAIVNDVGPT